MNAFAFKVIDAINREGMDNGQWDLAEDVDNTVAYFGTKEEIELIGQWHTSMQRETAISHTLTRPSQR